MTLTIVISRKIYVSALILASLLIVVAISSQWVLAQGLVEYGLFTTICVKGDGSVRAVADPIECKAKEEPSALVNANQFLVVIGYIESLVTQVDTLQSQVTGMQDQIDALQAQATGLQAQVDGLQTQVNAMQTDLNLR